MVAGDQEAKENVSDDAVGTGASSVKGERIFPLHLLAPALPGSVKSDVVVEWKSEGLATVDVAAVCEPAQDAETNESENVVDKMSVVIRGCWAEEVEKASQEPSE